MALTEIPSELSSTPSIVDNGNSTAITIDSSENVTFSGTLNGISTTKSASGNRWGISPEVEGNGVMEVGRYLDFHSTDGDTSDYGARLDFDGTNIVSTNAFAMSSGIYLGGTGAANKLDSYEEGTWTPTIFAVGGGTVTGITVGEARYTKVGRNVNIYLYISSINLAQLTTGTYIALGGLPFICNGYSDFNFTYMRGGTNIRGGYAQSASSYIYLCDGNGYEVQQSSNDTVTHMIGACAYITNS